MSRDEAVYLMLMADKAFKSSATLDWKCHIGRRGMVSHLQHGVQPIRENMPCILCGVTATCRHESYSACPEQTPFVLLTCAIHRVTLSGALMSSASTGSPDVFLSTIRRTGRVHLSSDVWLSAVLLSVCVPVPLKKAPLLGGASLPQSTSPTDKYRPFKRCNTCVVVGTTDVNTWHVSLACCCGCDRWNTQHYQHGCCSYRVCCRSGVRGKEQARQLQGCRRLYRGGETLTLSRQ